MAVESARLGVETKYWPMYEVIDGNYMMTHTPKKEIPVSEWMFLQGRFKHLMKPEYNHVLKSFQEEVDRNWNWVVKQAESATLISEKVN